MAALRRRSKILPRNGILLRMLTLDPLDKVAKGFDFHLNTTFSFDFFYHDQTSLDSLDKVAKSVDFLLDFLSSEKFIAKSRRLAGALLTMMKPMRVL